MQKNPVRTTKKFVYKHRVALAVALTAAVAVKWQANTQAYNKAFLEDHGLYEQYLESFG